MKKELGQYYTKPKDVYDIIDKIDLSGKTILEPSMGDGSFYFAIIDKLLCNSTISEICECILTGVDLDSDNIEMVSDRLMDDYGYVVNELTLLYQSDFLLWESSKQFDIVIGNPPYISHGKIIPTNADTKEHYIRRIQIITDYFNNSTNLCEYFILHALSFTNDIVFVIPDNLLMKPSLLRRIDCNITFDMYRDRVMFNVNQSIIVVRFDKTKSNNIPLTSKYKSDILFADDRKCARRILSQLPVTVISDHIDVYGKFDNFADLKDGVTETFHLKQNRVNTRSNYTTNIVNQTYPKSDQLASHSVFLSYIVDMIPLIYKTPYIMAGTNKFIGLSSDTISNNDIVHTMKNIYTMCFIELTCKEGTIRSGRTKYPGFFGIIKLSTLKEMQCVFHSDDTYVWDNPHKSIHDLIRDDAYMESQYRLTSSLGLPKEYLQECVDVLITLHNNRNRKLLNQPA